MSRRIAALALGLAVLALGMTVLALAAPDAGAHAGLISSDPPPGARLGATPNVVRLTFSELPDPGLSSIVVSAASGAGYQTGRPSRAADDALSLVVAVRPLPRGAYTVHWRVDSQVDGHATTGAFSFGVLAAPARVAATQQAGTSALEVVSRWLLLTGLVIVLGGASAAVAGFGGSAQRTWLLGAGGWLAAAAGLGGLALAQRDSAGVRFGTLLGSPVGAALIWRALAIGVIGLALLIGWRRHAISRAAGAGAGLAAVAAIAVHVANGHAAAGRWPAGVTVIAQTLHFTVAGVWIGGLAALLVGLRGMGPDARARAVRRFARIAGAGLAVVVVTGIVRAFSALHAVSQLVGTGYGRAVVAKLVLVAMIGAVAALNRGRATSSDAGRLHFSGGLELTLGAGALAVAAVLGTLAPPVAASNPVASGLLAHGTDFATTVRASLSTVSNQPGPNQFTLHLSDYDSGAPVAGASVRLLFNPLDDPAMPSTELQLGRTGPGTYGGTGDNLVFDGRWEVLALIRRRATTIEVPLELDPVGAPQSLSIQRIPGQPATYTKLDGLVHLITVSPSPEHAGPSQVSVHFGTAALSEPEPVDVLVLTLGTGRGPVREQAVRRVDPASFVAAVNLSRGQDQIAVTARTSAGVRLRSVFDLRVP